MLNYKSMIHLKVGRVIERLKMINYMTYIKKRLSLIIVIGVILLLILPIKYQVEVDQDTSIYRFNKLDYDEKTTVTIEGTLYRYLIKPDKFVGKIIINEIDITTKYDLLDVVFRGGQGSLHYVLREGDMYEGETIGNLIIDKKFGKVLITISEGIGTNRKHWRSGDGMFISLPSSNRDSAVKQAIETAMYSGWLKGANWDDTF